MFVRLDAIRVDVGDRVLFQDLSAEIAGRARTALIGPNGAGKSTLLEVVAGARTPTAGTVVRSPGIRIGYLRQDPPLPPGQTVWEAAEAAGGGEIPALERRLRALEARMQEDPGVGEAYARTLDRYAILGGYDWAARVREHLAGVGLRTDETTRPVATLSGGERVRLSLACLLLSAPDLLILDEPTNHLDLAAITWLEAALSTFRGAVLFVTHDRALLRSQAEAVWAFSPIGFWTFRGGYDAYRAELARRIDARMATAQAVRAERARLEAFVRTWSAGNRSRQAKDRERKLARLPQENDIGIPQPGDLRLTFGRRMTHPRVQGLRLTDLGVRRGNRTLWEHVTLTLAEGSRTGIIGPNGSGKSTFLKVLTGDLVPDTGTVLWADGTRIGVLDQEVFVAGESVMDAAMRLTGITREEAHRLLAQALFSAERLDTPVGELSGGERTRLALALLSWEAPDVLCLDEPTNHLDIDAQEALETALTAFSGTLLVVSHDRAFLEAVVDRYLLVADGTIRPVASWTEAVPALLASGRQGTSVREGSSAGNSGVWREGRSRPRASRTARPDRAALRRLEEEISRLEARKAELERMFQGGYRPDLADAQREYERLLGVLEARYGAWTEMAEAEEEGRSQRP